MFKFFILLSIFAMAFAIPQDYSRQRRSAVGWDVVGYGNNYGVYDGVYGVGIGIDSGYGVDATYRLGNYHTGYYGGYHNGYNLYDGYHY